MDSKELGRLGERRAVWFYRMRGYSIVGRNVRLRGGEIDLVVQRRHVLAFVEVKTRQSLAAGEGFEAVDRDKQLRLVRLADAYLARCPHRGEVRYDVLSLFWTGTHFIITHYPDAFQAVSDPRRPWRWTM
ncbi:MAG TPA: YraN family protein [Thermoanaerobaculia bacterium]|nr:YraN family protein [Thermoanaerobaculia bacterium]